MKNRSTIIAYHDVKEIIDGESYTLEVHATLAREGSVVEAVLQVSDYLELENIKRGGYIVDANIKEEAAE